MRFLKKHVPETILPFIVGFAVLLGLGVVKFGDPSVMQSARNLFFDYYQRISPREYVPVPVRILDIDETSIDRYGQWPWNRKLIAEIVSRLREMGASAIVFDILFAEPDRTSPSRSLIDYSTNLDILEFIKQLPDYDLVLADAIKGGRVVTSFVLNNDRNAARRPEIKRSFAIIGDEPEPFVENFNGSVPSLGVFESSADGNGAINFLPELDGIIRKAPLVFRIGDSFYPSLVTEALRVAQGDAPLAIKSTDSTTAKGGLGRPGIKKIGIGAFNISTNEFGEIFLHYTRQVPERTFPVWRLLDATSPIPSEKIAGNIVLIGTSAAGLLDMRFEPLGNVIPGVQVHAQALEQIMTNQYLKRPEWAKGVELAFLIAAGLVVVITAAKYGAVPSAAIGGLVTLVGVSASWGAFVLENFLVDPFSPSVFALIAFASTASTRYFITERKQRFLRQAFSSYVSPNLVEHIVAGEGTLLLGGERREISFIFTDLESFTAMVEENDPDVIMPIMNEYLDDMIGIVFDYGGTLDKVVGDALHVMFSAPVRQENHADLAVECVLAMDKYAEEFRKRINALGVPFGRTRIGVNTGDVIVGNFGGNRLFDYTAHGDAINTTARLESANKTTGTRICVAENTVRRCKNFNGRPIADLMLRGKQKLVGVFEPLLPDGDANSWVEEYNAAFDLMKTGDEGALAAFRELEEKHPDDVLVSLHFKRLSNGEAGTRMVA